MDINKIQQQMIQALEQKNADQLTTLARIVNLVVGKSTSVEVLSSEPMTLDEQNKLQQQTATALSQVREQIRNLASKIDPKAAQWNDKTLSEDTRIPPSLRNLMTRLLNQQEMLHSPKLRWLEISHNGQKITLYTDQPIKVGQKIPIQMANSQRLTLVNLPNDKIASTPSNTKASTDTTASNTPPNTKPNLSNTVPANTIPTNTTLTEKLLAQAKTLAASNITSGTPDSDLTNADSLNINLLEQNAKLTPELKKALLENLATNNGLLNNSGLNKNLNDTQKTLLDKSTPLAETPLSEEKTLESLSKEIFSQLQGKQAVNRYEQLSALGKNNSSNALTNNSEISDSEISPNHLEATDKLRQLYSLDLRSTQIFSLISQIAAQPKSLFTDTDQKSLEQLLKNIAERIRTPEHFFQASAVKQAIRQSGLFYENKVFQTLQNNISPEQLAQKASPAQQAQQMLANPQLQQKLENLNRNDNKGALLKILELTNNNASTSKAANNSKPLSVDQLQNLVKELVRQSLSSSTADSTLKGTSAGFTQEGNKSSAQILTEAMKIIEQLQSKELSNQTREQLSNQLIKLVQQEAAHGIAKIQVQQLQHLLQTTNDETVTKNQTHIWQMDVPVKLHNDVHTFNLEIQRQWVNPDRESPSPDSSGNAKVKQWNINLRFDLPIMGEFCAQLVMQGENLSAKLWAEREQTLNKIKRDLDQLKQQMESDGIVVKSLQCTSGMPAKKNVRLSYSLIDIST